MLRALPGVGSVRVPLDHDAPGGPAFDLAYAEAGAGPTLLLLPGGPGLASVLPYWRIRRRLAAAGLHVVTPEHRGVGLSRHLPDGSLLPREAVTMEQAARDVLAVLDAVGRGRAVLAGSSYGGFLALEVARRAGARLEALVIDSAGAGVEPSERELQRAFFWDGSEPGFAGIAGQVRALARAGIMSADELALAVPLVYEFAGREALERLLARAQTGRVALLRRLSRLGAQELEGGRVPLVFDGDLVAPIALGRITPEQPDGRPFDRARALVGVRAGHPGVHPAPFDARPWLDELRLPTLVLQGARDMRIPPVTVDELLARLHDARRIRFPHAGHDLLLTRTRASAAIVAGLARDGLDGAERAAASAGLARRPRRERWAARAAAVVP
jgi:proline iminopeptidase